MPVLLASIHICSFAYAFSVDNLEKFTNNFLDGKLKPYIKSEPVPESNDEPVKVSCLSFHLVFMGKVDHGAFYQQ